MRCLFVPLLLLAPLPTGQILEHQAKRAEARSEFEQAVKIDRCNEDAKKALQGSAR